MIKFSEDYRSNMALLKGELCADVNFDIIHKELDLASGRGSFFYIDGFVKDGELQRVMQFLLDRQSLGDAYQVERIIPYVEVEVCVDACKVITAVLSGQTAFIAEGFGAAAILLDLRTYPARETSEPESDRLWRGRGTALWKPWL